MKITRARKNDDNLDNRLKKKIRKKSTFTTNTFNRKKSTYQMYLSKNLIHTNTSIQVPTRKKIDDKKKIKIEKY